MSSADEGVESIVGGGLVDTREARMNVQDGNPLGVMVFLSADELAQLGVNLEASSVSYWIDGDNTRLA